MGFGSIRSTFILGPALPQGDQQAMELGTAYQARRHQLHALAAILALLVPLMSPRAGAAALEFHVLTDDGKPVAGAVLTLRATKPERASAAPIKAVMDQQLRSFVPHVLIVPLNSTVSFPNSDSVSHQVYSFSPAKKFQLPLYHGSPNPPVQFDRAGVVTLGCNIHDAMRAYIFVVDGQYYGRSDAAGAWSIAAAEPGEYEVQAWHPLARELQPFVEETLVVLPGTQLQRATLQATAPLRLRP
jgi:plastocyanin